ncbi:MAG: hypothetical protein IPN69_12235 [Acidobacteria bacterium]|nr:hypothetical protein [Acidobacteriota bacterium]MBK8150664.1 hypothetical protein [Acidobacteriota bacterium]MBK8811485.1 hypothetical protein [Acidobacteriota bacterium]
MEQVRNGAEIIVKNRNRPVARLMRLAVGDDLDAEEEILVNAFAVGSEVRRPAFILISLEK